MIHNAMRRVLKPSRHDPGSGPVGELGVLFDQSPIAMVFRDRQLRARPRALRRPSGEGEEQLLHLLLGHGGITVARQALPQPAGHDLEPGPVQGS
jgi:hypothetical protein